MPIKFRYQLILAFSCVTALALAGAIALSAKTADDTVRSNADRSLRVAEQVFDQLLDDTSTQLKERVSLLADDFGFREAIATKEQRTIISVLANHGARINAEMMFLLGPDGSVRETTHELDRISNFEALIRDGKSHLIISEGGLYQIAIAAVKAPDLIGWVGMGYAIDTEFARQLKSLTLAEVTLVYGSDATPPKLITTLSALNERELRAMDTERAATQLVARLNQQEMISHRFAIDDAQSDSIEIILTNPMAEALAEWRPWQRGLWGIGLASMLFTALTGWLLARSVTRPITQLVQVARAITSGNYDERVTIDSRNEFGFLASSMNEMEDAVRDREAQILHQARHEGLTGLPTRARLRELIAERNADKSGYLLIQINKFREFTEVYGLDWTDRLLQLVASALSEQLRNQDLLARIGRDQFVVYCHNTDLPMATTIAGQIATALSQSIDCDGIEVNLETRIGLALGPEHGDTPEDLLRRASVALSNASVGIEGLAVYENGQDLKLFRQQRVTQRLQRAIDSGGLSLHFQPKFDLHRNRVTQVEALLRWEDEELGKVFPDEFIPLAERSGDIYDLSDWVMQEAARTAVRWEAMAMPIVIGVNVSGRDFKRQHFVQKTLSILEGEGAKPEQFLLEITESATIENIDLAISHLNALSEAGFQIAIDDFGTGFSSLNQLKRLPADELKIDKSFVLHLDSDPYDHKIVRATINLGHNLGMYVVAEGVESHTSLQLLRQMHCDIIQGYHLSRPLPRDDFEQWWQDHDSHIAHAVGPQSAVSVAPE